MSLGNPTKAVRALALFALCVCAQAALAQPSLAVRDNTGTVIPHNGTYAQGNHSEVQYSLGMQLRNNGSSDLSVTNVVFSGHVNCSITAGGTYPRIVAPSTQYVFNSTLVLNAVGAFSATCTVTSNDPVNPSYVVTVSGTATTDPNVRVTWAGGGVVNNGVQNIGSTYAPGSGYNITLTVTNYAIAAASALTFAAGNSLDLQSSNNCTVMLPPDPTGSLMPGASVNVVLNVTPTAAGAFDFVPRIYTNDPDTPTWSATFNGTATTTPVIRVNIQAGYRPSGSDFTVMGATAGTPHNVSGSVQNNGSQNLVLSGSPPIAFSAQVNCTCTPPTAPTSPILPGMQSNFELAVTPVAVGNFSFDITIANNDPADSSYVIHFSGTTVASPPNMSLIMDGTARAHNATHAVTGAKPGTLFNVPGGVSNSGGTTLNLTGTPLVAISALTNCTATLTSAPLAAIPASQTSTFVLAVTPTSEGPFSFTITVASDDPDTPSYVVNIAGTAAKPKSGGDDDGGCTAGQSAALPFGLALAAALSGLVWRRRRARA